LTREGGKKIYWILKIIVAQRGEGGLRKNLPFSQNLNIGMRHCPLLKKPASATPFFQFFYKESGQPQPKGAAAPAPSGSGSYTL